MSVLANLMTVLDEEHALAVVEYRRVTIKAPLTAFAAKILAKRLAEFGDANAAAEIMIERIWRGFNASWVGQTRPRNAAPPVSSRVTVASMWRDEAREQGFLDATDDMAQRNEGGHHPTLCIVGGTAVTPRR
jgi:hypothetical protein